MCDDHSQDMKVTVPGDHFDPVLAHGCDGKIVDFVDGFFLISYDDGDKETMQPVSYGHLCKTRRHAHSCRNTYASILWCWTKTKVVVKQMSLFWTYRTRMNFRTPSLAPTPHADASFVGRHTTFVFSAINCRNADAMKECRSTDAHRLSGVIF